MVIFLVQLHAHMIQSVNDYRLKLILKIILLFLFYNFLLLPFFSIYSGQYAISDPFTMIGDRPSSLLILSLAAQYIKPENKEYTKIFKEINYLLLLLKKNKNDVKEKFHK